MKLFRQVITQKQKSIQSDSSPESSGNTFLKKRLYKLSSDPKIEILLFVIFILISIFILDSFVQSSPTSTSSGSIKESLKLDGDKQKSASPISPNPSALISKDLEEDNASTKVTVSNSTSGQFQSNKVTINGQTINLPSNSSYTKTVTSNDGSTNINIKSTSTTTGSENNSSSSVNVKNFTD